MVTKASYSQQQPSDSTARAPQRPGSKEILGSFSQKQIKLTEVEFKPVVIIIVAIAMLAN